MSSQPWLRLLGQGGRGGVVERWGTQKLGAHLDDKPQKLYTPGRGQAQVSFDMTIISITQAQSMSNIGQIL